MNNKKTQSVRAQVGRSRLLSAALVLVFGALVVFGTATAAALPASARQFAQVTPTSPTGSPPITVPSPKPDQCPKGACIIKGYIDPAVKALAATAGVIAVVSLIIAGIQYSSAGGDPSKVGAAKARIGKTIGAFLAFIFLYVFLNYIVPGGV
jgi:hypothetical protein